MLPRVNNNTTTTTIIIVVAALFHCIVETTGGASWATSYETTVVVVSYDNICFREMNSAKKIYPVRLSCMSLSTSSTLVQVPTVSC